jgi:hypothetical protein
MNLVDIYYRYLVKVAINTARDNDTSFDINKYVLIKNIDRGVFIFNDQEILPGQLAMVYNESLQHFLRIIDHKVVLVRFDKQWLK